MRIRPKTGWFDLNLRELFRYWDLILLFVHRDYVAFYKQTILGPLWYLLQPLLTTLMFTIVFGRIANLPADGVPHFLFYLAGNVAWSYFADCITGTSNTFVTNAGIFGKVYFPRLAMPISVVISNLIKFGIQVFLLIVFMIFFASAGLIVKPSVWIFWLPLLVFQMALLGLGFGILISSLTTKYRDLTFLVSFGIQLWMFSTPVVYPLSLIQGQYRALFMLNPMATVVETFRCAFLGVGIVDPISMGISWGITLTVLIAGVILFTRIEKTFMDTV
jgi:lipopolysaccharide transport system permease protein